MMYSPEYKPEQQTRRWRIVPRHLMTPKFAAEYDRKQEQAAAAGRTSMGPVPSLVAGADVAQLAKLDPVRLAWL
jgi:hypothetical protein